MGLDIYVGSLTRYYSGNWQTIVQQYAAATGIEVRVVRPKASWHQRLHTWFKPSYVIRERVNKWKHNITEISGVNLSWNEEPDYEYFTDKPAWDCYGALLLWAAFEDQNATTYPATTDKWEQNP